MRTILAALVLFFAFLTLLLLMGEAAGHNRVLASWYGPGLYGNRMACGGRLTTSTWGVAHKALPCGTRVLITERRDDDG